MEEAVASGIEDIIVITGRGKRAIEDHFDRSVELEENLKGNGKGQLLSQIRHISNLANFCYVRQSEALGLGHAVLCAQHLIGDEPFAVMLGDEIIDAPVPGLAQLIQTYKKRHGAVLGVQEVPHHEVNRYGIVSPDRLSDGLYRVRDLVEKPAPADAPSNLAVIGRYVLPPEIFPILRKTKPGKNGEIQLTDALRELAKAVPDVCTGNQGQPLRRRRQVGLSYCDRRICVEKSVVGRGLRRLSSEPHGHPAKNIAAPAEPSHQHPFCVDDTIQPNRS